MSNGASSSKGYRGPRGKGPFRYRSHEDNHVIWPGRKEALLTFIQQSYGGIQHKFKNAHSSNSEDALTWSCFDVLAHVGDDARRRAVAEIWELAFDRLEAPEGVLSGKIEIGRRYGEEEATEIDVSIEGPDVLVFFEAKLYSPMSQADLAKGKLHNQIERKLRVGLREADRAGKAFYFVLLDLAPLETLRAMKPGASLEEATHARAGGFGGKWITAYWFARYKYGTRGSLSPLQKVIADIGLNGVNAKDVAMRMGWLTWADLFKAVLRAVIETTRPT
ncbi:MAG TPA: hypothetical protein VLA99_02710 [Nitrospiraceae bacterium]|nr:hypothetical protein [Nitrospiraceae bacterium]